jgi:hypothetical protein
MATWFYRVGDQNFGPYTNAQLLELVRGGKVGGDTYVRKDDSNWVLAQAVGGLIEAATDDKEKAVCPYCGESIPPPPTRCESCRRDVSIAMRGADERQIHRQTKSITGALNPYEEVTPEKDETAQSHFLIILMSVLFMLAIPLSIYLWFNADTPLVKELVGGLLGSFVVITGYAYYLAVKTNNRRDD